MKVTILNMELEKVFEGTLAEAVNWLMEQKCKDVLRAKVYDHAHGAFMTPWEFLGDQIGY